MYASRAQINFILSLASQLAGEPIRFMGQAEPYLPISKTACRNLTKSDAALCIDNLKAQIKAAQS